MVLPIENSTELEAIFKGFKDFTELRKKWGSRIERTRFVDSSLIIDFTDSIFEVGISFRQDLCHYFDFSTFKEIPNRDQFCIFFSEIGCLLDGTVRRDFDHDRNDSFLYGGE